MATRYKVIRQSVRFCKQTYHVGDLLPESFSERDLYRILYPSRVKKVDIPDEIVKDDVIVNNPDTTQTPATASQGVNNFII